MKNKNNAEERIIKTYPVPNPIPETLSLSENTINN